MKVLLLCMIVLGALVPTSANAQDGGDSVSYLRGWNLVAGDGVTTPAQFAAEVTCVRAVWTYIGQWHGYFPGQPPGQGDNILAGPMQKTLGYWVYCG